MPATGARPRCASSIPTRPPRNCACPRGLWRASCARKAFAHVDAIKLDVEGAEDLIIEPFLASVPRDLWPKLLIMEYGGARWAVDLFGLLRERGYREVLRTRTNVAYELG